MKIIKKVHRLESSQKFGKRFKVTLQIHNFKKTTFWLSEKQYNKLMEFFDNPSYVTNSDYVKASNPIYIVIDHNPGEETRFIWAGDKQNLSYLINYFNATPAFDEHLNKNDEDEELDEDETEEQNELNTTTELSTSRFVRYAGQHAKDGKAIAIYKNSTGVLLQWFDVDKKEPLPDTKTVAISQSEWDGVPYDINDGKLEFDAVEKFLT